MIDFTESEILILYEKCFSVYAHLNPIETRRNSCKLTGTNWVCFQLLVQARIQMNIIVEWKWGQCMFLM